MESRSRGTFLPARNRLVTSSRACTFPGPRQRLLDRNYRPGRPLAEQPRPVTHFLPATVSPLFPPSVLSATPLHQYMTKPIPPGGIRQRPARSCVACRSSKTKCVGAVVKDGVATADVKCTRCLRLDLECSFVDLRRFGRPRRNPVGVGSASSSRERKVKVEAKVDDDTEDAWEAVEEPRASRRIGPVEPKEHWSSSGSSSSSGGSTLVKGRAASPLPKGEPMYFEIPQLYPLPDLHTDRNPALDHVSFLARDYLENIHPFLALLPDDFADLTHYLRSSSPVLSMALYSLLNAAEQDVPIAHYATSLSDLQAAVVSVYCAYAGGRPNAGRDTLEWICGHIIGKGWHRIDAWSRETLLDYDQQFLDGVRVLWWECWCLEILMCITTGVRKLFLQSVDFNVRLGGGATVSAIVSFASTSTDIRGSPVRLAFQSPHPSTITPPHVDRDAARRGGPDGTDTSSQQYRLDSHLPRPPIVPLELHSPQVDVLPPCSHLCRTRGCIPRCVPSLTSRIES